MKRILFLATLLVCCVAGRAQHVVFDGLELTGKIIDFSEQMRQHGFKLQKRVADDCYYIYKGTYCGHSSYVQVAYTPKSHTVYKVQITPKHVDVPSYLDSLVVRYGDTYTSSSKGYQWANEHGGIFLITPEGYDPTFVVMDKQGAALFKEEKAE